MKFIRDNGNNKPEIDITIKYVHDSNLIEQLFSSEIFYGDHFKFINNDFILLFTNVTEANFATNSLGKFLVYLNDELFLSDVNKFEFLGILSFFITGDLDKLKNKYEDFGT